MLNWFHERRGLRAGLWTAVLVLGLGLGIAGAATLRQKFQEVEGTATAAGVTHPLAAVRLKGERLVFILAPAAGRSGPARYYEGIVRGERIEGNVKILSPEGGVVRPWRAQRVAQGGPEAR